MPQPSTRRLWNELDQALATVFARPPIPPPPDRRLPPRARRTSVRLLRVDDAGEIAAQGLYRGQAFFARRPDIAQHLEQARREEEAHLLGCRSRLAALGGRPSLLGPLWYAGGWLSGAFHAFWGDGVSLGYVAETERQVVRHLDGHLRRLPPDDFETRSLLERMRDEEAQHAARAQTAGAHRLPPPIPGLMSLTSRVMTTLARWI